jgi:hypothetical protein
MLMRALHPKERAVKKRKALRRSDPGAGHLDKMLDEALGETFPASDPVAITMSYRRILVTEGIRRQLELAI